MLSIPAAIALVVGVTVLATVEFSRGHKTRSDRAVVARRKAVASMSKWEKEASRDWM